MATMKSTAKIPHTIIRNIRFKSAAQIALIKKAADHHNISFNGFVVRILEHAAVLALELPQNSVCLQLATRALEENSVSSRKKTSK